MLGGQPPYLSGTPQATLARHLSDTMPSLVSVRDSVPKDVEDTIRKALSKAPADRHASTMEFANAVQRVDSGGFAAVTVSKGTPGRPSGLSRAAGIFATLLAVVVVGVAWSEWSSRQAGPVDFGVTFMPLENHTGDLALDGLGRSIADGVVSYLQRVPEVRVKGTYSVAALWGQQLGLPVLMNRLDVSHLFDGYYERVGSKLVVTVRENDPDGFVHDTKVYPVDPGKLDSAQVAIAHDIAEQFLDRIGVTSSPEATDVAYGPGREAYLAGNSWLGQRTPASMRRAVTQFNEAIRLEGTYAPAHAGLSSAYMLAMY